MGFLFSKPYPGPYPATQYQNDRLVYARSVMKIKELN